MIKVFFGEDRTRATEAVKKFLGEGYEIVEGAEISAEDLPNIFRGMSLFSETRAILIRDILANKSLQAELPKYLDTKHKIAFLELKVDKRANVFKALKDEVEFLEFKPARNMNAGMIFDIYNIAKRDGKRAVKMVEQIQNEQDPIMFTGLLISQALKDFSARPGEKEKRVLLELSKLDIDLKSSNVEPWLLVKSFLLRLA